MTVWTDEMIARAAGMKRAGLPAATIAQRLGVSVKAVNQKMSRVGARMRLNGKTGRRMGNEPMGRLLMDVVPNYSELTSEELES